MPHLQRYRNEEIHDPHLRFYTAYDREAKVFDSEFVFAWRENLSEILVVVRWFILFPGGAITYQLG